MSGRRIPVPKAKQKSSHSIWVPTCSHQAPPSSTSVQSSLPNSDLLGETYRACNDDSFVEHSGEFISSSGKIASHNSISNELDGRSASNHRHNDIPLQDNTRFDRKGKSLNINATVGFGSRESDYADEGNSYSLHSNSSSFGDYGVKVGTSSEKVVNREENFEENTNTNGQTKDSVFRFDICPRTRSGSGVKLKAPLLVKNRELRKANSRNSDGLCIRVLRPGMLLLNNYISLEDQVKVIRKCRELGVGPGGFYLPGYEDGAKLKLKMMCLGKNWDPETSTYGDRRPCDDAKPPLIPEEFLDLVNMAIKECHSYLLNRRRNVETILPSMTPDICIVNFYTKTGRLGLHQDKDESQESLRRGLPVVSFSIGDSAEFVYGDERNVDKAEKIILESGDVLIFGCKARHIYHGVSTILPDTAPKNLSEETNLRSGRLNLTFREY